MACQLAWDPEKERINKQKHGLDFSFADPVFSDPLAVTIYDRFENGEHRWHTIGAVGAGHTVLLVVHTLPDTDVPIRIIGLRRATAQERRRYEQNP